MSVSPSKHLTDEGGVEKFLPKGAVVRLPNGEELDESCPVWIHGRAWLSHRGTTPSGGPDPTEYDAECDGVVGMDEDGNFYDLGDEWLDWGREVLADREAER